MDQAAYPHTSPIGEVLIADDDGDFRGLLVRRARKMGLKIAEAFDGDQAIQHLQTHSFDVIIVDLYMPGCSGLDVVRQAQQIDKDIQAVILTASASLDTALEALRAGVYDYLTKPLESMTIFELTLSRALERRYLIRENKRLFQEIQRLAMTDPLTGLFNRHKLQDVLEHETERARRYGRPLALMMLDMDKMKHINDSYGHSAGDRALKQVAGAIQRSVRKLDLAVRMGGDEFLILLPEADLNVAGNVASRINAHIAKQPLEEVVLSVSIGMGQWQASFRTAEQFLHAVDQALYQAKRKDDQGIYIVQTARSQVAHLKQ